MFILFARILRACRCMHENVRNMHGSMPTLSLKYAKVAKTEKYNFLVDSIVAKFNACLNTC